jgi:hypothetical protein
MIKLKPKDVVLVGRLIIKLFRYSSHGYDKEERKDLADDLTEVLVELLETLRK